MIHPCLFEEKAMWPFKKEPKEYIVVYYANKYEKVPVEKDKDGKEYATYFSIYWLKDEAGNWRRASENVLSLRL